MIELTTAEHDGITVVRDDLMPGGTKARVLPQMLGGSTPVEYVYASPVYGYAQIALAQTASQLGKRATIFCAKRKRRHQRTLEAENAGARIVEIEHGYLTVVRKAARQYCQVSGAAMMPFGFDSAVFIDGLADVARSLDVQPTEVWAVSGSGVLMRALQQAWPLASFNAVRIGAKPNVGKATLYEAPEKFEQDAKRPPPFPSCSNYDAKARQFVKRHATPGALFWNVAG